MTRYQLERSPAAFIAASCFLLVLVTIGCAENETPIEGQTIPVTVRHQEIQGGSVDRNSTAVVGLFTMSSYGGGMCTGSLIAPNMVLTAQHCVSQLNSSYVVCGRTRFGSTISARNIFVTTATTMGRNVSFYDVSEVIVPQEDDDMCGNDVAVLILSQNVPDTVATPLVPRIDQPVQRGEEYSAVGYGHTGDGYGSGTRRRLDGLAAQCDGPSCPRYGSVTDTEWLGDDGTCQGDSGGPAIDVDNKVLGALSRGADGCQFSLYSGVYRWADWLRELGQRAADAGGYDPHAWVALGVSEVPLDDLDLDGITVDLDNCAEVANPEQSDVDGDGFGDACDPDLDNDGIANELDNCAFDPNEDQLDFDGDGEGDGCDLDDDDDNLLDIEDNCPLSPNLSQDDADNDGYGDACDNLIGPGLLDDDVFVDGNPSFLDGDDKKVVGGTNNESCTVAAVGTPTGSTTPTLAALAMLLGILVVRRRR